MATPASGAATGASPSTNRLAWGWVMLGPIGTWALHLNLMYFLVQPVCRLGGSWTFHAVSIALLAVTLLTGALAWRMRSSGKEQDDAKAEASLGAFIGTFGVAVAALASLAIVAQWMPVFVIGPCQ